MVVSKEAVSAIQKYVRAANYISASQIFLGDNFLLDRPLSFGDIKPRLLGHWGTAPGVNFIYANLNYLIKKHQAEILFVLGPGHGYAGLQANLFMEGTLGKYFPFATQDLNGLGHVIKNFSWPYGFPSHTNPGTPGAILEGGELGYSLGTAYGAVLDNPNLIAACVVGDGEAETGAIATAWHLSKFFDPATNGAVLPILHLNGYKISGPTIFGRMSNSDLLSLFKGYGYAPSIVEGDDEGVYEQMIGTLEKSYQEIREIQKNSKKGKMTGVPRWPMIVLKTPKGWTGIKELGGLKVEGNYPSHQVVAAHAKEDVKELHAVENWLKSYKFEELFDPKKGFVKEIKELVPDPSLAMGNSKHARGGEAVLQDLKLPSAEQFAEDANIPGTMGSSSMRRAGLYLNEVFRLNKDAHNFRMLSPDETYSNKLDVIFESTSRSSVMPAEPWDKDMGRDGRVTEMLSEHSLQGLMQGYVLTGRHAVFASYEAFVQIIASMADQYAKFIGVMRNYPWHGRIPSLNYILTSSGWRQEHNGFSHQNPGFIDDMLHKRGCFTRIFFPPDGNSTLVVLKESLATNGGINLIVAGKTLEHRWLTPDLAAQELKQGLMVWDFASDDNPQIVFGAAGDYLTKEALAAIAIIKSETPNVRVRFVNILELSTLGVGGCHVPLTFEKYFTADKPVIFNFHGYPQTLKELLFDYHENTGRFSVHGYIESGSTTTPFDMQVRNETSRYHLVMEAYRTLGALGDVDKSQAKALEEKYQNRLTEHREFIKENGVDPQEIENWQWKSS